MIYDNSNSRFYIVNQSKKPLTIFSTVMVAKIKDKLVFKANDHHKIYNFLPIKPIYYPYVTANNYGKTYEQQWSYINGK